MTRLLYALPLVLAVSLGGLFYSQLGKDPNRLESVLIDQEVPPFDLPAIEGRDVGFGSRDLVGQVTLVNVFGSWCVACRAEHGFLVRIKANKEVPIYGINWRERDRQAGPAWLRRYGDPYTRVGDDPDSKAAIAFGVTGAPESFIVDKRGVIRYKHTGPLDARVWKETIKPLVEKLQQS